MPHSFDSVHDFALQLEKTLHARRLYNPTSPPYREAGDRLLEKMRAAVDRDRLTLRLGTNDLFLEDRSVFNKAKREEAFFFPLYRDGLRELTFTPATSPADVESLLQILELREQHLGPDEDTVSHLWRADLTTIHHVAVDALSDGGADGSASARDLRALSLVVLEKIMRPQLTEVDKSTTARTGQEAIDAAAVRTMVAQNPAILTLSADQITELQSELGIDRDEKLLERFIEMLLVIARLPFRSIEPALIAPILGQLIESYWRSRAFDRMAVLITHINAVARDAPNAHTRATMSSVIATFLTDQRLQALMEEYEKGAISPALASSLWELVVDEKIWPLLLDSYSRLPEGEAKATIFRSLCGLGSANIEMLTRTFWSPEHHRVRAAMTLLDPQTELLLTEQLIPLANHNEESARRKGLAAAARSRNPAALEVLWNALQNDPSKSVRLYAFKLVSTSQFPELAPRLRNLIATPHFAERPVWEREKYVRLLGTVAGAEAEPLFESWIPAKKLMWNAKDLEALELALRGLASCGDSGYEKVQKMIAGGGKQGEIARRVLDSISRVEIGETVMRPLPAGIIPNEQK